jgi:methylated-DNA-protein-cysteine methyltransferase related protein
MMETTNQDLQETQPEQEGPSFKQKLLNVLSPREEEEEEEKEQLAPSAAAGTPMATEARVPVTVTPVKREAHEAPAPEPQQQQEQEQEEEAQQQPPPDKRQKLLPEEEPPAPSPIPDQTIGILESIKTIPAGQTRTYSEVAFLAGYPSNASAVGKIIRGLNLPSETSIPWHRVVGQDGRLRLKDEGEVQLRRLVDEGARPREEESIGAWMERAGKKVVGVYAMGSQKMVFTDTVEELGEKVNRKKVEGFDGVEQAEERGWVRMATQMME